jgi:hypothetical protein
VIAVESNSEAGDEEEVLNLGAGEADEDARVPCIVHMDSFPGLHDAQKVAANLRSYYLHEYRAKRAAKGRETGRGGGESGGGKRCRRGSDGEGEGGSGGVCEDGGEGMSGDDDAGLSFDAFVEELFGEGDGRLPLLRLEVKKRNAPLYVLFVLGPTKTDAA